MKEKIARDIDMIEEERPSNVQKTGTISTHRK